MLLLLSSHFMQKQLCSCKTPTSAVFSPHQPSTFRKWCLGKIKRKTGFRKLFQCYITLSPHIYTSITSQEKTPMCSVLHQSLASLFTLCLLASVLGNVGVFVYGKLQLYRFQLIFCLHMP